VQSSTSVIAQAATIGFVIEAMRQIVSAAIGVLEPAPRRRDCPLPTSFASSNASDASLTVRAALEVDLGRLDSSDKRIEVGGVQKLRDRDP
jgi:hypothetical protein